MSDAAPQARVTESPRERPVLYDVDVAVAGAGLCGTFAAIAAGRCGARTVLIDRFGSVGGNLGPGMVVNGGVFREADTTLPGGLSGLAREFVEQLLSLRVGPADRYPEDSGICSQVAYEMLRQAGVELLLGLLVCSRGAGYLRRGHDPTGMRARPSMMVFGQCVGTAAALTALDGTTPRGVDLKKVQQRLLADGIVLGEPERLRRLGLAESTPRSAPARSAARRDRGVCRKGGGST